MDTTLHENWHLIDIAMSRLTWPLYPLILPLSGTECMCYGNGVFSKFYFFSWNDQDIEMSWSNVNQQWVLNRKTQNRGTAYQHITGWAGILMIPVSRPMCFICNNNWTRNPFSRRSTSRLADDSQVNKFEQVREMGVPCGLWLANGIMGSGHMSIPRQTDWLTDRNYGKKYLTANYVNDRVYCRRVFKGCNLPQN